MTDIQKQMADALDAVDKNAVKHCATEYSIDRETLLKVHQALAAHRQQEARGPAVLAEPVRPIAWMTLDHHTPGLAFRKSDLGLLGERYAFGLVAIDPRMQAEALEILAAPDIKGKALPEQPERHWSLDDDEAVQALMDRDMED